MPELLPGGFDTGCQFRIVSCCMEFCLQVRAPAKINLHLGIRGRRPDGYHDLRSLFQAVDLYDDIHICSLIERDALDISGEFDCPPESTTIFHAVMHFREMTGWRHGLSISVVKRIPSGAGLGGGSSDAASILNALMRISSIRIPRQALLDLAASVGSDVPFFLSGGAAEVSGRGELIHSIPARTDYKVLLIFPGFGISTRSAFALLDAQAAIQTGSKEAPGHLAALYAADFGTWSFHNSFLPQSLKEYPCLGGILEFFRETGAFHASMSGSGSTMFGLYRDSASMYAAETEARSRVCFCDGTDGRQVVAACSPLAPHSSLPYDEPIPILDPKECRDHGDYRRSDSEGHG